jgi:hypothetical protein
MVEALKGWHRCHSEPFGLVQDRLRDESLVASSAVPENDKSEMFPAFT